MLSIRRDGESLPEIIGRYLGLPTKQLMRGFTVVLMILVGAVFVAGPAGLLAKLTPGVYGCYFWIIVMFVYYMLATLLPVHKIIEKYIRCLPLLYCLWRWGFWWCCYNHPALPEITDGLHNTHLPDYQFFLSCLFLLHGAISGFHATQSPLMARCVKNEKYGRPIFYGAMVTEGIMALICCCRYLFFYQNGMEESNALIIGQHNQGMVGYDRSLLAVLGAIAALLPVEILLYVQLVLIVADFMHLEQKKYIAKRLLICIPIFAVTIGILLYSPRDAAGFDMIWRFLPGVIRLCLFYFVAVTVFLVRAKKNYYITFVSAFVYDGFYLAFALLPEGLHFLIMYLI